MAKKTIPKRERRRNFGNDRKSTVKSRSKWRHFIYGWLRRGKSDVTRRSQFVFFMTGRGRTEAEVLFKYLKRVYNFPYEERKK